MPASVDWHFQSKDGSHVVAEFDCGVDRLNHWLRNVSTQAASTGTARVYVGVERGQNVVKSYYSLSSAEEPLTSLSAREQRGLRSPVPALIIGMMGVDQSVQRSGLGRATIGNAFGRALLAASHAGAVLLLVDPIDDTAAAFYTKMGFGRFENNPARYYIGLKTIRKLNLPPVE